MHVVCDNANNPSTSCITETKLVKQFREAYYFDRKETRVCPPKILSCNFSIVCEQEGLHL